MRVLHIETMVLLGKYGVLPRRSFSLSSELVGEVEIFLRVRLLLIHLLPAIRVFRIEADTKLVLSPEPPT
jgi:hypothetical protein